MRNTQRQPTQQPIEMTRRTNLPEPNRRDFLVTAGSLAAGLTLSGALSSVVHAKSSDEFDAALAALTKGAKPVEDKVRLEIDAYIENGNMVFYRASVEHPMRADDYVRTLHILSNGKPVCPCRSVSLHTSFGSRSRRRAHAFSQNTKRRCHCRAQRWAPVYRKTICSSRNRRL